jgi:hypothetical protein
LEQQHRVIRQKIFLFVKVAGAASGSTQKQEVFLRRERACISPQMERLDGAPLET